MELLVVVYAIDKFRSYFTGAKVIYSPHGLLDIEIFVAKEGCQTQTYSVGIAILRI